MRLVAVGVLALILASAVSAQDLETILEANLKARGGRTALASIRSLTFVGTRRADGRGPAKMYKMRPYFFLVGCTNPTCGWAEGFDGSAWEMDPSRPRVVRVKGEAAKAIGRAGEFDDPFIDYAARGHSARLLGREDFDGRPVYAVEVILKDGLQQVYYFDAESFLVVANRRAVPVHARGEHIETLTRFGDYRPVNGFLYARRLESRNARTGELLEAGQWEEIIPNEIIDSALFSPPLIQPGPGVRLSLDMLSAADTASAGELLNMYRQFRARAEFKSLDTEKDLDWLGYELLKADQVSKAIAILQLECEEYPGSANAYDSLGDAFAQAGQTREAIRAYRKALELKPDSPRTAAKLQRLQAATH